MEVGSISRLLSFSGLLACGQLAMADAPPNIVLIVADDLGAHTLGIDGNPFMETPNLDALAQSGMRFSQGYANAPICKPTRSCLMTGQYTPRTQCFRVSDNFRGDEQHARLQIPANAPFMALEKTTIAELLGEAGYRTAHFGKWHLSKGNEGLPDTQGFDTSIESHRAHFNARTTPPLEMPEGTYIGDFMTDRAIAFMNEAVAQEKPFFLYLPYFLIHKPLEAKEEHIRHFREKLGPDADADTVTVAAMVKSLDENAGRVLRELDKLQIREDTLVVFTSDNGGYKLPGNILNGDLRGSKGELYQGGIRVPYIFSWPGHVAPASTCSTPVISMDLFPTFLSVAGLESPADLPIDGVNLLHLVTGEVGDLPPRALFWFFPNYAGYRKNGTWRAEWRNAVIHDGYKLIEYPESGRTELYNLEADPFEKTDLSDKEVATSDELQTVLSHWKQAVSAPEETPNPNYKR